MSSETTDTFILVFNKIPWLTMIKKNLSVVQDKEEEENEDYTGIVLSLFHLAEFELGQSRTPVHVPLLNECFH